MKPADYLSFYSTKFDAVELDNTFYRTPAVSTVKGWYAKTPPGFLFAVKVPQAVTHEKVMVDCDEDFGRFLGTMDALGEKLGPLLLRFGYFNRAQFESGSQFLALLKPFLEKVPKGYKFAVEIRNKAWLDARSLDLLRKHGVALALIDQSWMPRPWELKDTLDLVTTDFTYVRWSATGKRLRKRRRRGTK